jgi:hypothetical protein
MSCPNFCRCCVTSTSPGVVTVDAGRTVRAHVRFLVGDKMAHYVVIVKQNQKTLFDRLDTLD